MMVSDVQDCSSARLLHSLIRCATPF